MEKLTKGDRTRSHILKMVNNLFNEEERLLTLDEIAGKLNIPKSRILNHFSKKELLMLGLYEQYQKKLSHLLSIKNPDNGNLNFTRLADYYSEILDLFYDYRFTINFLFVNPLNDEELDSHLISTYHKNKERIFRRVESLVARGLVHKGLLVPDEFSVFLFKHTNLMTTWTISLRLYYKGMEYKPVKPLIIKSLLSCFESYLTRAGRADYSRAIEILNRTTG